MFFLWLASCCAELLRKVLSCHEDSRKIVCSNCCSNFAVSEDQLCERIMDKLLESHSLASRYHGQHGRQRTI